MADAKTAEGDLSPIALPADALPTLVSDFGLLMGLLTQSDGTTYFDLSWFQTALNHIEAIPRPACRTDQAATRPVGHARC